MRGSNFRSRPPRGARLVRQSARLAGQLALLLGGVALAVRVVAPRPSAERADQLANDVSGRGPPSTPPSSHARASGHETQDLRGGLLGVLVAGLFVVAGSVAFGMIELGRFFESRQENTQPAFTAEQTTHLAPPEPHLQDDPVGDLARLRAAETQALTTYGWTDSSHAHARIPISRAMMLVVGKSLDDPP